MSDPPTPSFVLDVRDVFTPIPAHQPTLPSAYKLAILGGCPNADSFSERKPFAGMVGKTLWTTLGNLGVPAQSCYANNLSPTLAWTEDEKHLASVKADLLAFGPSLVLFLGATGLRLFRNDPKAKIAHWRGSLFSSTSFVPGLKCLATPHPSDVFVDYSLMPLFRFDLRRAAHQSTFPDLRLPERQFQVRVDPSTAILLLNHILPGVLLSLDIEGGVDGLRCISFSQEPSAGFIVPWDTYTLDQQVEVAPVLARVLASRHIPKVLQNSLYDNFVLTHIYKMPIRNVVHDTMLSGWEIYPELPKGLGVQTSIWTEEPYYKEDRKTEDQETLWRYCCRDSAVTLEIHRAHVGALASSPSKLAHYRFNVALLSPLLFMELHGINYDKVEADRLSFLHRAEQAEVQKSIDAFAKTSLNLNSPKQTCHALYDSLGYPTQHPKDGRSYDRTRRTADVEAILTLKKLRPTDTFLDSILHWRHLDKLIGMVGISPDPDGRIRCGYNVVGTETGRLTCYKTPTGTGANLQTVTKKLRYLFRADPGHHFFQCDLAGADGWTVAAHSRRLGDETMMLDYRAGIKPAKVIALLYRKGVTVNTWTREQIIQESRAVTEEGSDGWLYFACKRVQHGTNYGLGKDRMSAQILQDSFKKMGEAIVVSPSDCLRLQKLYLSRYGGVALWQKWVKDELVSKAKLDCASGQVRTFFGRRDAHSTYMEALAHEPQANTTFATNLAVMRLWTDPENRDGKRLIIQPLHQVHDALCGQFPQDRVDWSLTKIRSWFDNPLTIANQQITIPFGGGFGPSWGECDTPI